MNKKKFFKLYTGPGYPVDPKLEAQRQAALFYEHIWFDPEPFIASVGLTDGHRFLLECERLLTGAGKN